VAALTVNDVAVDLMTEVGEDTGDAALVLQFERWVSNAFQRIGITLDWKFNRPTEQITTAASTQEYSLTDTKVDDIRAMRINGDDDPLFYKEERELFERGVNMEQESRPMYYWFREYDKTNEVLKVAFWPVPDAIYTIDVLERAAPGTLASADELPYPREFVQGIEARVKYLYYMNEEKVEIAVTHKRDFDEVMGLLVKRHKWAKESHRLATTDVRTDDYLRDVRLPPDHFNNMFWN
jgi:hypothetical protein